MLPVNLYSLNADRLRFLWEKFTSKLDMFGDLFPLDMAEFLCWISNEHSVILCLGPVDNPRGLLIFTDVVPGDSAASHIFVWDKEGIAPKELHIAVRNAIRVVMLRLELQRVIGLIPVWRPEVRAFAKAVGLVYEGTLQHATKRDGEPNDLWLMAITQPRFDDILKDEANSEE
jgi:hypothetical protein